MTKKLLIIRNLAHSKYKHQIFGDEGLGLLEEFLQDLGDSAGVLKWLQKPTQSYGGNLTTAHNENEKIIIRYGIWDDDDPELFAGEYITTAPQLIDIIHQWNALKKINLDAILIEQDEVGDVTMRAVAFDEVDDIINKIENN